MGAQQLHAGWSKPSRWPSEHSQLRSAAAVCVEGPPPADSRVGLPCSLSDVEVARCGNAWRRDEMMEAPMGLEGTSLPSPPPPHLSCRRHSMTWSDDGRNVASTHRQSIPPMGTLCSGGDVENDLCCCIPLGVGACCSVSRLAASLLWCCGLCSSTWSCHMGWHSSAFGLALGHAAGQALNLQIR